MSYVAADLFGGGGPDYAGIAAENENKRQVAIAGGTQAINKAYAGFDDNFYKNREKSFIDSAMPQLTQQYTGTRNQIGFNLANRGLLKSGAADSSWNGLAVNMAQAKQNVNDSAVSSAHDLQKQIEESKTGQLSNLYSSADPSGAGAQAVETAASFARPATIPILANQFQGLLNQYYTSQLINAYRPQSFVQSPQMNNGFNVPTTISMSGQQ